MRTSGGGVLKPNLEPPNCNVCGSEYAINRSPFGGTEDYRCRDHAYNYEIKSRGISPMSHQDRMDRANKYYGGHY